MVNNRHVSAPYFSIRAVGSTPLFLDFDIFSIFPNCTDSPSSAFVAETTLPLLSLSKIILLGLKYVFTVPLLLSRKKV